MTLAFETFVGRDSELARLSTALGAAEDGHGTICVVSGEPGIGKSRLVEELARRSGTALVAWGRCWEAGGAPPYWPFTQILRTLIRKRTITLEPFVERERAPWLVQLVPELRGRVELAEAPRLEPEQARFRLFDSVMGALSDAAEQTPLLLILEDLHAADASSVQLLEFLAQHLRAARILLVVTLRESDARRGSSYPIVVRLLGEAHRVVLEPLDRAAVERFLTDCLGERATSEMVDATYERTEGNPLFLTEISRRREGLALSAGGPGRAQVPSSVQTAILERMRDLTAECRSLLDAAASIGRELDAALLAGVTGVEPSALTRCLTEAVDRAVLIEVAENVYRFSHILVRETLHESLEPEARAELHRRIAVELERREAPSYGEVAHHYLQAGAAFHPRAIEPLSRAGRASAAQLAFAEACDCFERALALLDQSGEGPTRSRCELLLDLAAAQFDHGRNDAGWAASLRAAEMARALGEKELFARAVLAYGRIFVVGEVKESLIALLEEALEGLDPGDSPTRAVVMARLAAAQQPSLTPEPFIGLAREAIAMARRLGDDETLLATMRSAISALMDLADPRERLALNAEHVALAERLGRPLEVLRGQGRLVFDAVELGEHAIALGAIDALASVVDDLRLAQHRWRVALLRGMCAAFEGRFSEAERYSATAAESLADAADPTAARSIAIQRYATLRLRGLWDEAAVQLERVDQFLRPLPFGATMAELMRVSLLAERGAREEATSRWREELSHWPLAVSDLSLLELCAEAALGLSDRTMMREIADRLGPHADRFMSWGIYGAHVGPPAGATLGRLMIGLGQRSEGEAYLRGALERTRRAGGRPHCGWICLWLAELDVPDRAGRAREALDVARELEMPGLIDRVLPLTEESSPLGATQAAPPRPPTPSGVYFRMRAEGDVWAFECGGSTFRLKDRKGFKLLAHLVEHPGEDVHVLDLDAPASVGPGAQLGDAGEMIDAEARAQYRRRAAELREELEEAEAWNDSGRAAGARAELAAIEEELARSVGLGGRVRRSASAAERARVNVQRRLRDAIRCVAAEHKELGRHLQWAIRTGTFCSYRPE